VSAETGEGQDVVLFSPILPDSRRKGSPPLPDEHQEEQEEDAHLYPDELVDDH
jgi:hypothetical protein